MCFIDEFQALFTKRSNAGSGRLTSALLQCMDDVARFSKVRSNHQSVKDVQRVLVLAATNTPWMIDKAFLRPGRFDRVVRVDLPDLDARAAILVIQISRMSIDVSIRNQIQAFCRKLATFTEGFSGADLSKLCHNAGIQCLLADEVYVNEEHFEKALSRTFPSKNDELIKKIRAWHP